VSDKAQATVRIKWVRSGIGFTYHQKCIVRSLGLKKLNQEVERPDTPQIRGLVAKVPHLVKIVAPAPKPAWMQVPEYVIYPPEAKPAKPSETVPETRAVEAEKIEAAASAPVPPLSNRDRESGAAAGNSPPTAGGPASPGGEESGSSGAGVSPGEGQPKA